MTEDRDFIMKMFKKTKDMFRKEQMTDEQGFYCAICLLGNYCNVLNIRQDELERIFKSLSDAYNVITDKNRG